MTVTLPVALTQRRRTPFELGYSPSPASITPAFVISLLNSSMSASSFGVGITPASLLSSPLTNIMNRIVVLLVRMARGLVALRGSLLGSTPATNGVFRDRQ